MLALRKYPRTRHVAGSALQPGDEDLTQVSLGELGGRHAVIEEKLDGANAAISFAADGKLMLQSRGHYLTGGARERHFALFKQWAHGIKDQLWPVLGTRYVVYGEWLYAKHTIYYDLLPHYFLEFDVLDRETDTFLDTPSRRALLNGLPLHSVPVIEEGVLDARRDLTTLVRRSAYKSPDWRERLAEAAMAGGHKRELVLSQTDPSDLMEGLYIKIEEGGTVRERLKWVRADFLATVRDSESHWLSRPIVPNGLTVGGWRMGG